LEDFQYYFKKFENAIAVLLVLVLLSVYLLVNLVVPKFKETLNVFKEIHNQEALIKDTTRKLEEAKQREMQQEVSIKGLKAFYHPIEPGADTETIMVKEIGDVLVILSHNKVKTRAIRYTYDPPEDTFIKHAPARFSACLLDVDIIAEYRTLLNFLRDLYRHEYFININKVEIIPYRKNKKILLVNLQITLYAQKDRGESGQ
jgi:hypothetical protein